MSATTAARPSMGPSAVPQGGGNGRAIVLAILVHALLGALLFFGVRWQSSPPAVIQAELWSATPQVAAPPPRAIPPPPKVEAPRPEPKAEPEPPQPRADIVEKVPPKAEPKKKEVAKVEPKPLPKVIPPPAQKVEPPKQKPEPVKLPPKEAPLRAPSDLASLLASANGDVNSTGKDQQTSGPRGRDGYIARLVAAIRPQMRYPASSPGNPSVIVRIEQLPNGEVSSVTVTKPSGVQAFDDAVDRAIRAASPLPRDEQGKVQRELELQYFMYEKN